MSLWNDIINPLQSLRQAFKNSRTFYWFVLAVLCFCSGMGQGAMVTEMMRVLNLSPSCYNSFLRFFSSKAIDHSLLRVLWAKLVLSLASPYRISGSLLLAIDEKKMPKEGRKMPASRVHYQSSTNNSKPAYIMGHSIMAIGLLAKSHCGAFTSLMPLMFSILGGIRFTPKDKRTCLDHSNKAILGLQEAFGEPIIIVADALYCVRSFAWELYQKGVHTISRIKGNGIAYEEPNSSDYKGRGRRPKYGKKVELRKLFSNMTSFIKEHSPIPGEENVELKYLQLLLIPKWFDEVAKFVLVSHPTRGKIVLFSSNPDLSWSEVYLACYYRFQIEITFKSLVYDIGAFFYRFWCKSMKETKIGDKDRYVHKEGRSTVEVMKSKLRAYECFLMTGGIAYSLLQQLALAKPAEVWASFGGWIRTIRPQLPPSIKICSKALSDGLLEFMHSKEIDRDLAKFYDSKCRNNQNLYQKSG